ncbi:MAG: hypothetical protein DCF19_09415, partial [Pseudanabaena frigida]
FFPVHLLSFLYHSLLITTEISTILGEGNESQIKELLRQGVCIPLFFEADCELDGNTLFVVGDLSEEEANAWVGKLVGKLNIPCGKLVLLCGGGDPDGFAHAMSGNLPDPNCEFFQIIEVPSGEYQVEIFAYLTSSIAQNYLEEQKENIQEWFRNNCSGTESIGYIIHLIPLESEPTLPKLVPEVGWCSEFEFREPE